MDDFEFSNKKDSKKDNEWEDEDENENEACGGDTTTSKIGKNQNSDPGLNSVVVNYYDEWAKTCEWGKFYIINVFKKNINFLFNF